jgi:hypothetical protein
VEGDTENGLRKFGSSVRKIGRVHALIEDHLTSFLENLLVWKVVRFRWKAISLMPFKRFILDML